MYAELIWAAAFVMGIMNSNQNIIFNKFYVLSALPKTKETCMSKSLTAFYYNLKSKQLSWKEKQFVYSCAYL